MATGRSIGRRSRSPAGGLAKGRCREWKQFMRLFWQEFQATNLVTVQWMCRSLLWACQADPLVASFGESDVDHKRHLNTLHQYSRCTQLPGRPGTSSASLRRRRRTRTWARRRRVWSRATWSSASARPRRKAATRTARPSTAGHAQRGEAQRASQNCLTRLRNPYRCTEGRLALLRSKFWRRNTVQYCTSTLSTAVRISHVSNNSG